MIDFSIVLMSRSRPRMMSDLYESIRSKSLLNNEIVIGLDDDDPSLPEYIRLFNGVDSVKLDTGNRNKNLHVRINRMIDLVDGKYIFVLNDDCTVSNEGWDLSAFELLNNYGDIVYGRTYDDSIDRITSTYAAFPIVSKIAAQKLGFIMDDTFGNHGSDVITYRIYEEVNAVVDLRCVLIHHLFHNSNEALNKRQQDKTAVDMIHRTFENGFNIKQLFELDIKKKANRLK